MLYKNPFVLQVVNAYLGPRPQFIYTAGNNASSGGTERQRVHKGRSPPSAELPLTAIRLHLFASRGEIEPSSMTKNNTDEPGTLSGGCTNRLVRLHARDGRDG